MNRIVALMGLAAVGWVMQDQRPSFRAGVELVQLRGDETTDAEPGPHFDPFEPRRSQ